MATITDSVTITFDGTRSVSLDVVFVNSTKFIKLRKSDAQVERMLTGLCVRSARRLTRTDIIEQIISLRNNKREKLIEAAEQAAVGAPAHDLGMDTTAPSKRRRSMQGVLPEIVEITTPSIGHIDGINMKVLMGDPIAPLLVEVTEQNVDYLKGYTEEQLRQSEAAVNTARVAGQIPAPCTGVVWSEQRWSFRARYKVNGQIKTKDFRPEIDPDVPLDAQMGAIEVAADAARVFMAAI